jgi:hypothetical protein
MQHGRSTTLDDSSVREAGGGYDRDPSTISVSPGDGGAMDGHGRG